MRPDEVRIAVRATAVNRADLLQRAGHYAPPTGTTDVLGLECAGEIAAVGSAVRGWAPGDRVCALLTGGGYAREVTVPAGQLLDAGDLSWIDAAALPEAICTAHDALYTQAGLAPAERVLIHAGASGVGTTAVQLCRESENPCFVTVGSDAKIAQCVGLGAQGGWNRHSGSFAKAPWLAEGVDVIVDPVAAGYLGDDLAVLRNRGRLVVLGLLGGRTDTIDLGRVLIKRLQIHGTVLRSRSRSEKAAVVEAVRAGPWNAVLSGRIRPVIDGVYPLKSVDEAHARLASNQTTGKLVLTIGD